MAQIWWLRSPMSMPMVTPVRFGPAVGLGAGLVFLDVVFVFMGRVYHGARRALLCLLI